MDLPEGNIYRQPLAEYDEKCVGPDLADQAAFYVDLFNATDLNNQRSVGGYVGTIGSSVVILYSMVRAPTKHVSMIFTEA